MNKQSIVLDTSTINVPSDIYHMITFADYSIFTQSIETADWLIFLDIVSTNCRCWLKSIYIHPKHI